MKVSRLMFALSALVMLCSCGGGSGDSQTSPPPVTHKLGGSVSGLVGSRLVLRTNDVDSGTRIGPAAGGSYSDFFGSLSKGTTYNVTVATQPTNPSQTCVVKNGTGTISDSDITNIEITCTTNPGRFVYAANFTTRNVSGYEITPGTGALTPVNGSPFTMSALPDGIEVDPAGGFAYVTHAGVLTGGLSVFTIDRGSGVLSLASTADLGVGVSGGGNPRSLALHPSGRFVYVTTELCPAKGPCELNLHGFIADRGVLTAIPGSPFENTVDRPFSVVMDPVGRFLYVPSAPGLQVLRINPETGALSVVPGSPFSASADVASPSGKFLYRPSNGIYASRVDGSTGAVTAVPGAPFATGTEFASIAIDPRGQFAYAVSTGSDSVSGFTIDANTGALTPLAGSPFPVNSAPGVLIGPSAVDPLGEFLYVGSSSTTTTPPGVFEGDIVAYKIDRTTGALTSIGGSPFDGPSQVWDIAISN